LNWFERYGIPGLYFVGLMAGWVYAFCPQIIRWENLDTLLGLIAALIAISLPIGYIVSIIGQSVYLRWLGVHGAAMDQLVREPEGSNRDEPTRDEAIIEARTLLLTAHGLFLDPTNTHRYIRDWIARRMDVIAINQSLFLATLLAGIIAIIAFVICRLQPGPPSAIAVIILSIISVAVILAMILSIRILRRQVIEVIAGIYRTYR